MEEHTITDIVSEDSSQVVRDVITGEGGLPGLDDEADGTGHLSTRSPRPKRTRSLTPNLIRSASRPIRAPRRRSDIDADDAEVFDDGESDESDEYDAEETDPLFADAVAAEESDSDDDILEAPVESTEDRPASPPRPGSVAAALADEIRAGEVNSDDLSLIQQELDLDTPESANVRIRHLQSRVDDLAAYTEALEEFIDDNGTAKTLIEDFENEVESVRDELGRMGTDIESAKDEGAQARARVADLETNLDDFETSLQSDLEDLESDVDELGELGSNLDGLESQLNDLEDLVATNTQESSALDDEIEDLRDDFETIGSLEDEIESVSDDVSELSDSVSAAGTRMDEKIETLRADVETIESELNELNEWRNQLGSVFGGN